LEGEVNCDQLVSLKVILPGKKMLQDELYLLFRHPLIHFKIWDFSVEKTREISHCQHPNFEVISA